MNRCCLLAVGSLMMLPLAGIAAEDPVTLFGPTMGTAWSVKLAGLPADADPQAIQRAITGYLDAFDAKVSTYRDDSELARFNASRDTDWFAVSQETAQLLQRTLEIARQTSGAFDPTVAPLTELWKFDRHEGRTQLPSDAEIAAAHERVGYQHLQVRLDPPALRKEQADLELNLNAVAPGWAVDRIVELLRQRGLPNFLVDVGSEIRTGGRKSDGGSWLVGIERPADKGHVLQASLVLDDRAIATSGDYRNFYVVDGQRYSHTIDPRTGRPVQHGLASVTVIADDCTSADAWATAMSVLGPDAGLRLADREGLPVWMMVRSPSGELQARSSQVFAKTFASQMVDLAGHLEAVDTASREISAASTEHAAERPTASAERATPQSSSPWLVMLITLAAFLIAAGGLAIGLVLRGKPLAGSCGGLAGMKDEQGRPMCGSCSIPPEQCDEFRKSLRTPTGEACRNEAADQA